MTIKDNVRKQIGTVQFVLYIVVRTTFIIMRLRMETLITQITLEQSKQIYLMGETEYISEK